MEIKYKNKVYNYKYNNYISLHHNIINFYENILQKELNILQKIYISHLLYHKKYNVNNEFNKDSLLHNKIKMIYLKINDFEEKDLFDIIIPYIKVIIISLLIIIRIDIFLSTSFNNHIKSFEDYYILLLYLFILFLLIIIPYYSYKVITRFIQYTIEHLDKDIGIFMSGYIESYNIIDYNKRDYVDKYIDKCKKIFLEKEDK